MYFWTAMNIYKNPMLVYSEKIKPNISTIVSTIVMNLVENYKNTLVLVLDERLIKNNDKTHFFRELNINPQNIFLKLNKKN